MRDAVEQAVAKEREACAEIARFARMHSISDAIMKRGRNMSTKPEKIDTSEERVHETDKSIHDDDIQIQMKSRDEIADSVMNVLLRRSSPDVLKESPLIIAEWAYGLSDAMLVMSRAKPHSFESNRINIKLMEKIVVAMEKEK
jgi:hypothetical protein